jgi:hypothetical protein
LPGDTCGRGEGLKVTIRSAARARGVKAALDVRRSRCREWRTEIDCEMPYAPGKSVIAAVYLAVDYQRAAHPFVVKPDHREVRLRGAELIGLGVTPPDRPHRVGVDRALDYGRHA